ncbi:pyridoxal phosphate-dependent aminotransferase [Devosia sp. BK]|uniref:pyridoxal phosphate-dependent aminotransferase n=1 Tax=Devosia sp. BK TaxID=2871706 RepID=UPI002939A373|nr:pyridoxal phosphate-dependent aminotransferase [Devosia sp. BK]MDV3250425.1 pyridoxal phosphate-dependent aminotransferase [Devosia sp. BK]
MAPPRLTEIAENLPETVPFVGPEAIERRMGIKFAARIGANESGFGPSPKVLDAIRDAAAGIWQYPDPENHDLRTALAKFHDVTAEEVVIGEGVDGLMGQIVRLFLAPGEVLLTSLGAYPTLNYHVIGHGGRLEFVPYAGAHEDLTALAEAAQRLKPRIVYLANPDNPMGSFWPAADVERFIAAIPEDTLIMLDEAYGELAPEDALPAIDTSKNNVLRLRSFSKAYGLAGIRVGYAIGPKPIIGAFNCVRNHFGVNRLALAAALAALDDQDYLAHAKGQIAHARDRIAEIARENGLNPLPSATNFVAVDCGRDGAYAAKILEELAKLGVFIRKPGTPGLDHHIRISVGPKAAMDLLAETLPKAIAAAQSGA